MKKHEIKLAKLARRMKRLDLPSAEGMSFNEKRNLLRSMFDDLIEAGIEEGAPDDLSDLLGR